MPVGDFAKIAREFDLEGKSYDNVMQAYNEASKNASAEDTVFIGGSTFVVADLLANLP
jgi:dihydrofolate synthase/folylpolyglutamate synthase